MNSGHRHVIPSPLLFSLMYSQLDSALGVTEEPQHPVGLISLRKDYGQEQQCSPEQCLCGLQATPWSFQIASWAFQPGYITSPSRKYCRSLQSDLVICVHVCKFVIAMCKRGGGREELRERWLPGCGWAIFISLGAVVRRFSMEELPVLICLTAFIIVQNPCISM